ncbi:hypothetical protein WJX72_011194 [[Myrmecia] bisecta]|uniref:Uncharacterized protein n=1 Tax=[Myrmecia] bisecta TaxID=41462 RepID=A0AAW1PTR3_9CHLO
MQTTSLQQLTVGSLVQTGITEVEATLLLAGVKNVVRNHPCCPTQAWREISKELLTPDQPFLLHQLLLRATFSDWHTVQQGPIPVWTPTPETIQDTNLAGFLRIFDGGRDWLAECTGDPAQDFPLLQRLSHEQPEVFWPPVLKQLRIRFQEQPDRILEEGRTPDTCRWLPGARLNIAASALMARDPDAPAVVWAEEGRPALLHTLSLGQLSRRCLRLAAALRTSGCKPGDAVAIAMPMTVSAVIIYFGIILCGCAVVSIADSFSAAEISTRLQISRAVALFTQDVVVRGNKTLPLFTRIKEAGAPAAIVVPASETKGLQVALRPGDLAWMQFLDLADDTVPFTIHITDAGDTTNILFSSGTTGEPKAIPWSHVTPLRCAVDAWAHQDVRRGDVVCWPTNLGWMMGPWLLYAALLNGAAIALYQGSPLGRDFGQFVAAARVTMLGLVPSIAKAWRSSNCMQGLDWACVRCFSSSGEASAAEDYHWLMARAGYKPVIEYCGGTEIGGGFLSGTLLQPQAPSHFSTATLGSQLVILGEEGRQSPHGSSEALTGELALVPPLLGSSQRLLNRDHFAAYYQGMPKVAGGNLPLRRHGDEVERLPGGFYVAHGRCDDTMNLGGIKVSSVELERACMDALPEVLEAAAVGLPAAGGGPERLALILVLRASGSGAADVAGYKSRCQQAISSKINPLFKVEQVLIKELLPRTASNKVMRRVLRDQLRQRPSRL